MTNRQYLTPPRSPGPGPVMSAIAMIASGLAGVILVLTEVVLRFLIGMALTGRRECKRP